MKNYSAKQVSRRETGYVRDFSLSNTNSGVESRGRLHWDEHDGFEIFWDYNVPPEWHTDDEFAYELDKMLGEQDA